MKKPVLDDNPWRAVALVSAIGVDLVFCMAVGYFAGKAISHWIGGHPLWILIGILAGLAAGILSVVYLLRMYMEDKNG